MTKKVEELLLESRYRFYTKIGLLVALGVIVIIDSLSQHYQAPTEVLLSLVGGVVGIETREQLRKREVTKPTRKRK